MNPNKFYQRTKLFNEIIYEIFNVESNYRTELSVLNLKLIKKINEHKNAIKQKVMQDKFRQTLSNTKNNILERKSNASVRPSLTSSKSKDSLISDKEENPLIDKLISEGLEQLLAFYKIKHKLISKEVSNLGVILYDFSSSQKKFENYEDLLTLDNLKNDFEMNFAKLMGVKKKYNEKMNSLELFFHEEENKKIIKEPNKDANKNDNKNNKNKIEENLNEKEKIDELIHIREKYKKYLNDMTSTQKLYIAKINEIGKDIQEFNITENNILLNIFKVFEDYLISLLKEVNNYCLLYEHNKKLIQDLNKELGNNLLYDKRIYNNYQFEEYSPKFTDINNQKDFEVIQKMNKLIGFEFDKIKSNNSNDNKINDNNNYSNIDSNLSFILLMDKLLDDKTILNEKEINLMKNLLNQEKYIKEFLSKLNKIRIDKQLFNNKERFTILLSFFNLIYKKVSFYDNKSHDLIKFMMILSETFFYNDGEKKIFLNNSINIPPELKDCKFWINYIQIEIENESKKYENKNNSRYEYIVLLSNTTHLKEYLIENEKIKEIIDYFKDKYNFSIDELEVIKEQIQI